MDDRWQWDAEGRWTLLALETGFLRHFGRFSYRSSGKKGLWFQPHVETKSETMNIRGIFENPSFLNWGHIFEGHFLIYFFIKLLPGFPSQTESRSDTDFLDICFNVLVLPPIFVCFFLQSPKARSNPASDSWLTDGLSWSFFPSSAWVGLRLFWWLLPEEHPCLFFGSVFLKNQF